MGIGTGGGNPFPFPPNGSKPAASRDIGAAAEYAKLHIKDVGVLLAAFHIIAGFFAALLSPRKVGP
jgi:hypothetical protein